MSDVAQQPDIDRREHIEAVAAQVLPQAIQDVEHALVLSPAALVDPDRWSQLRPFAHRLLTAVLNCYVQGALSVQEREELMGYSATIDDPSLVHELLRTLQLVGIGRLAQELRRRTQFTRLEYLRLRSSAEQVEDLLSSVGAEGVPRRHDVLTRLHGTGHDFR